MDTQSKNIVFYPENYLCRGRNFYTHEWVYGHYVPSVVDGYEESFLVKRDGSFLWCRVISDTINRWTGYVKNGKKIWENDRIKDHFGEEIGTIRYGVYHNPFDAQSAIHVGFYVDWGENDLLRKDLGYWIDILSDEDNVIPSD